MPDTIKLAIIGTGMAWEQLHLPTFQQMPDKYTIVAISNPTIQKAEKAADAVGISYDNIYLDYHDMLKRDDIDAVDVIVPIELNYTISKDVILSGKHLICEKPLARNMEEAESFINLCKKKPSLVMIAENFRYNEEHNIIKHLIEEKRIGDVLYYIKNNMSNFPKDMLGDSFAAKEWRQHPKHEGGTILDSAIHDLSGLRHIFGNANKVSAFAREEDEEFSPYSHINGTISHDSGVIGHYVYCCINTEAQKPPIGFRIFGTEGNIYLEDKTCGIINVFYNNGGHEIINFTPKKGFYNEFIDFYNAFFNENPIDVPPTVEFGDMGLVFDLLKSVEEEKTIKVGKEYKYVTNMFYDKVKES